jgi:hypothetical protein
MSEAREGLHTDQLRSPDNAGGHHRRLWPVASLAALQNLVAIGA